MTTHRLAPLAMARVLTSQIARGLYISRHLYSGAVDVRSRDMTPRERRNPDLIDVPRRRRIAAGSGNALDAVNALIKQFKAMQDMMKKLGKGGMGGMGGMGGGGLGGLESLLGGQRPGGAGPRGLPGPGFPGKGFPGFPGRRR